MTDTSPAPTDRWIGQTFKGAYRIDSLIGTGAMGSVYKAVQLAVGRPVAVKILRTDGLPEKSRSVAAQRFHREAHATSRLNHPNTVRLIDFGETGAGDLFLVLELLQGRTLAQRIDDDGPIASVKAARIGQQIAKSLAEAHSLDIVHRDLKPDNVYLSEFEGETDFVKVVDFGIARMVDPNQDGGEDGKPGVRMTGERTLLGSPVYMSPEQAEGTDKVGPSTDLYALGVVLYECLTGDVPFDSDSYLDIVIKHLNEQPPPMKLPPMPAQIEAAWRSLVQELLSKEPENRPTSAAAVSERLEAILELEREAKRSTSSGLHPGLGTHITRLPTDMLVAASPGRRRVGLLGALLVAAAAVAIVLVTTGGDETQTVYKVVPPASAGEKPRERAAGEAVTKSLLEAAESTPAEEAQDEAVAAPAHLKLSTRPAGALVVRGDTIVCTTPCELDVTPEEDEVTLSVRKDGFLETPVTVHLVAGGFIDRSLVLSPDPAAAAPEPKAKARSTRKSDRRSEKRKARRSGKKAQTKQAEPEPQPKKLLPGFRKDGPKRTERD